MAAYGAVSLLGLALFLSFLATITRITIALTPEEEDFDFDGLPGANHEFRLEVPAGQKECFFQKVKTGSELHVSFEVLRGADRNIDMIITDPNNQQFGDPQLWKTSGVVDKVVEVEGTYRICLDNSISRFTSKLVYIYMITYSEHDWAAYTKDIESMELTVKNFTESINNVDRNVVAMKRFQATSRQHVITDWYIVNGNNRYVQYWAILSSGVIVFTSAVQTYFLRRLFESKKNIGSAKPRA